MYCLMVVIRTSGRIKTVAEVASGWSIMERCAELLMIDFSSLAATASSESRLSLITDWPF